MKKRRIIRNLLLLSTVACFLEACSFSMHVNTDESGSDSIVSSFSEDVSSVNEETETSVTEEKTEQTTGADTTEEITSEPEPVDTTYSYEAVLPDELPMISLTTDCGNDWVTTPNRNTKLTSGIDYVSGSVSVTNCDAQYELNDVSASLKVRGNYTLDYEQKPIRIKFDKKQKMLGMNNDLKAKSWLLLADYKDLAETNNALSFYLGNQLLGDDGYYCSDFRYVEVTINGTYWGVYLLAEQQQTGDSRIAIAEADEDYTGTDIGYFFEYDGYYTDENPSLGGDKTFTVSYDGGALKTIAGTWVWPGVSGYTLKSDTYSDDQVNFIASYTENVYKICYEALYNAQYYEFNEDYSKLINSEASDPWEVIDKVLDVDSLVDMYILQEISCDPDIGWSSFYMDVDMSEFGSKKLTFEAPWDYDSAYGIRHDYCNDAQGYYAATSSNPWLVLLTKEDHFQDLVKAKYAEARDHHVFENSLSLIDEISEKYETYFDKEKTRWGGKFSWNDERTTEENSCTVQAQAASILKRWLTARYEYLDEIWMGIVPEVIPENADDDIEGDLYRYELEDAELTGGILKKTGNHASGDGYLGNVSGEAGRTIEVTFNAPEETDAYLYLGCSKRSSSASLSSWFSFEINGESLVPTSHVPAISSGEEEWHAWTSIPVGKIHLNEGENKILISTVSGDATNLDYIDIHSSYELD